MQWGTWQADFIPPHQYYIGDRKSIILPKMWQHLSNIMSSNFWRVFGCVIVYFTWIRRPVSWFWIWAPVSWTLGAEGLLLCGFLFQVINQMVIIHFYSKSWYLQSLVNISLCFLFGLCLFDSDWEESVVWWVFDALFGKVNAHFLPSVSQFAETSHL